MCPIMLMHSTRPTPNRGVLSQRNRLEARHIASTTDGAAMKIHMSFAVGAAGVATMVLVGFALAGIDRSNMSQSVADQTSTITRSPAPTASSTQEAVTPTPPASSPAPAKSPAPNKEDRGPVVGPLDWDGGRWDVGNVVAFKRDSRGVIVVLDRYQMWQYDQYWISETTGPPTLNAGKTLIRHPLVIGNTDTPFVNESSKLHSYRLADNAEVVRVANLDDICARFSGDADYQEPDPAFTHLDVDQLVAASVGTDDLNGSGAKYDGRQDALTFGDAGRVVRVVFSGGC